MSSFDGPATISYQYKVGVKREIINALRDVFAVWPDVRLRGKVQVINEYALAEVDYPLVQVKFNETEIRNVGIGHFEVDYDRDGTPRKLLHWMFKGQLSFTVYANSPVDRDMIAVGLLNLLAFGHEIPEFKQFNDEIRDFDFVALQLNTENIHPGGDGAGPAPWGNQDDLLFYTTYSVDVLGEFFTDPRTSDLVQIGTVIAYPYKPGQPRPLGSQAFDSEHDDRTVPWVP